MSYKMFIKNSVLFVLFSVFLSGCSVSAPEEQTEAGQLKIKLIYKSDTGILDGKLLNILKAEARDFKIYKDGNYADVFQHPDQFLEYSDSIVVYDILEAAIRDSAIQVAYGSIPPLEYDSLYFQIAPASDIIILNGGSYPLTTDYKKLSVDNNYTKVVKIKDKISLKENKTTTLVIEFKIENNIFRLIDEFVFTAAVDTFYTINE